MQKIILVTGATSGFGKAIAEKFASNGYHCIITGRRKERLLEVANFLETQFHVKVLPLVFDVQDKVAVNAAIQSIPTEWRSIDILVNNAGLALGRDSFEIADISDWETMIDSNVKGLLYVTKAIIPWMIAQKKGHIFNMGSTAAKEVYKDGNVYCATKSAVDAISKAMRIDLLFYGIKVTAIHPGAADTEFSVVRFKGDNDKASNVYKGYEPLVADDVAEITYYCASLPKHVCINDLVVTCTAQANSFTLFKNEE
ncbi:MAG: SDR family NAD(P)-dependent oxidoreductase [Chitinophagaceae bacterium]